MVQAAHNPAVELVRELCQELQKDPTEILRNMQDNSIISLEVLKSLEPAELTELGFNMGLKKRLAAVLNETGNDNQARRAAATVKRTNSLIKAKAKGRIFEPH